MDPRNLEKQREPEEPRFLSYPHLPEGTKTEDGTPVLNRWSSTLTTGHNFPGAQVSRFAVVRETSKADMALHLQAMLYAAGVPNKEAMKTYPQVGIASVWWEGNPCK